MVDSITYAPLLPWEILFAFATLNAVLLTVAGWLRLRSWFLRGLVAAVLLVGLINPSYRQEDRTPLADIVFVVIDKTASQDLSSRAAQMEKSIPEILSQLEQRTDQHLEIIEVIVRDVSDNSTAHGTLLLSRLKEAADKVAQNRIAGAIVLSDGRSHDLQTLHDFPAPVHLLQTGEPKDWDRRLILKNSPAFGIVGESISVTLQIEDSGAVPTANISATVFASIDGAEPQKFTVPIGEEVKLTLQIEHAGINLLDLRTPEEDGEITDRNNRKTLSINGVRDRLSVLLVSGEPYAGERTWRNLLKADASVDLVHFTILRPPEKQDGVPVDELSLIAFPTRELFMEKIEDFDLIIFDRYRRRGVLPDTYLENVTRYVRDGGAILIAAGPAFAEVESLARSPMREVLPALPTGRVYEEGYKPRLSELGYRHPVTAGLADLAEDWGRWFRLIDMKQRSGSLLMQGAESKPLLVVDRVEKGRIAILASDHAWLWSRGFEGGGPQLELLRRLAHWLMQEPELEEEILSATAIGNQVKVERHSLGEIANILTVVSPSGIKTTENLNEVFPGTGLVEFTAEENGVFRITDGQLNTFVAVGPANLKEYEQPIGVSEQLQNLVSSTDGGVFQLSDEVPDVRRTRYGRVAKGSGWLGLPYREAYTVEDIRLTPLAPAWLILLLVGLLSLAAWRLEGE